MKIFKRVGALKQAVNEQDGSNEKYLLLLIALASIVKMFTGAKADQKIDELLQKITAMWGLVDIFAKTEDDYNSMLENSEHAA